DHHREIDAPEHHALVEDPVAGRAHQVFVEMSFCSVHHHVRDQDIIHFGNGLAARMSNDCASLEVFEVVVLPNQVGNFHSLVLLLPPHCTSKARSAMIFSSSDLPRRLLAMIRCWISDVPSNILVRRASRQCRSTAYSFV